jgi:hypothetical protein
MKQFLVILLFLPLFGISQSETQQKEAIRNNRTTSTQPSTPTTRTETQQKVEIRTQNTTPNYNFGTTPNYNFNQRKPYVPYYYNRWNRWGAPYNYISYYDFYHYDRFGYRTPARIYYKNDNTKDTVISKENKVRIGLNLSTKNKIGGWFTVGRDVYFKASFNKTVYSDQSTFYTNISMDIVRPWVINNPSQNYQLDNIRDEWSLYLGVGREFKNFGANISLGLGYENEKYQYFDGTYILSNNGRYSFKNFADNYTTLSIGLTHDYKSLSFSADFDPIRKDLYLGIGFNF